MTSKRLLEAALTLCTIGGAVFAVGATKEALSRFVVLPDAAVAVLMITGAALAIFGAIAFALSLIIDRLQHAVMQVIYGDVDSRYVCTYAKPSELAGLHDLYREYFGDDVPSSERMLKWLEKCPSALTIVYRVVVNASGLPQRQELVGSFKVLPLNRAGVRAIEAGHVTGSTLKVEHMCASRTRPSAYYVGDVVATTRIAKGVVIAQLNATISPATRNEITVYARPLTRDGLRIMTKHGFVQASDGRSRPQIGCACKLKIGAPVTVAPRRKPKRPRLVPLPSAVAVPFSHDHGASSTAA